MNIFPLRKPAPTIIYPRLDAPIVSIPLYGSKVPAGAFPSPADEYIEKLLDLNELLTPNPIAAPLYLGMGILS